MTSVWDCSCFCQKRSFVVLLDSSLPFKSELSDQLTGPLETKLSIVIVFAAAPIVPKYTKKDLQ